METLKSQTLFAAFGWLLLLAGCSNQAQTQPAPAAIDDRPLNVYTVNYPLQYFAQQIGSDDANVMFPCPADQDPAFWVPTGDQIAAYHTADVVFVNGATYAKWTKTASLPDVIWNTTAHIKDRYITIEDAVSHSHGPGQQHTHAGTAFTTWLDPKIAIQQAEAIADRLSQLRPQSKREIQNNFAILKRDLLELDASLTEVTHDASATPVLFSHPVYQYLERAYQLNGRSVHFEPDVVAPEKAWLELEELLKEHPAKVMIWEKTPSEANRKRLLSLGIESVTFDPCGNKPEVQDYQAVMKENVTNLATALGSRSGQVTSD